MYSMRKIINAGTLIGVAIVLSAILSACGAGTLGQGVQSEVQQPGLAKAQVAKSNLTMAAQAVSNFMLQQATGTSSLTSASVVSALSAQYPSISFSTGSSAATNQIAVAVTGQTVVLVVAGGGFCWYQRVDGTRRSSNSVSNRSTCSALAAPASGWSGTL